MTKINYKDIAGKLRSYFQNRIEEEENSKTRNLITASDRKENERYQEAYYRFKDCLYGFRTAFGYLQLNAKNENDLQKAPTAPVTGAINTSCGKFGKHLVPLICEYIEREVDQANDLDFMKQAGIKLKHPTKMLDIHLCEAKHMKDVSDKFSYSNYIGKANVIKLDLKDLPESEINEKLAELSCKIAERHNNINAGRANGDRDDFHTPNSRFVVFIAHPNQNILDRITADPQLKEQNFLLNLYTKVNLKSAQLDAKIFDTTLNTRGKTFI